LVALLERANLYVIEAGDASHATTAARKHRPDAALLDVSLPGVSGYGLCRALRDAYGPDLPVIFMSGERVEPIDRAAGILIGGDDYVIKPIDADELLARLRRLLDRSRPIPTSSSAQLSDREIEVLQLLAEGLRPAEMARKLVISPKTVSSHVQRILAKLQVHTRAQAVAIAYEEGWIRVARSGEPEFELHDLITAAPEP
jgi:DNA-binding NarL/FixJ family response regulator